MNDSQWPRFQVFEQPAENQAFQSAGTLHAADAEMALQTARDVFARRPGCRALWIAPLNAVAVWSQGAAPPAPAAPAEPPSRNGSVPSHKAEVQPRAYAIFAKTRPSGSHRHLGQVNAQTAEAALQAGKQLPGAEEARVLWALPEAAITRSRPEDRASFFDPAEDKRFRDASDYPTVSRMRQIEAQTQSQEQEV